jgi:hypothetical protein
MVPQWQALYHAAFAQAVRQFVEDARLTRYQRLVYQVGLN